MSMFIEPDLCHACCGYLSDEAIRSVCILLSRGAVGDSRAAAYHFVLVSISHCTRIEKSLLHL
jgi:hypothetical protein